MGQNGLSKKKYERPPSPQSSIKNTPNNTTAVLVSLFLLLLLLYTSHLCTFPFSPLLLLYSEAQAPRAPRRATTTTTTAQAEGNADPDHRSGGTKLGPQALQPVDQVLVLRVLFCCRWVIGVVFEGLA
jgi:hypothetical protein